MLMKPNDLALAPLMAHLVLGHPSLEQSVATAQQYADAGVRYIEVQLPFSHPTADGLTITQANRTALSQEPDWAHYWQAIGQLTRSIPTERLVLMTYANRIVGGGLQHFVARLQQSGITQLIVPDLPLDTPAAEELIASGIDLFPVIAANTPPERISRLLHHRPRFVYIMAGYRLTGQAFTLDARIASLVSHIRGQLPTAEVGIGFGISSPADVNAVLRVADIAIVGSALIQAQERGELSRILAQLTAVSVG
jgi:tryptophan synthase alpha chain